MPIAKAASMFLNVEDEFLRGYLQAAFWSSCDSCDNGDNPEQLDEICDEQDLSPSALEKMRADCDAFRTRCRELGLDWVDPENASGDYSAGYNFWLTRNRHGTGFWDRDYPGDLGDELSEIARSFGEVSLYVGDDGKVYYP